MRLRQTKPLVVSFAATVLVAVAAFQGLDLWWRYGQELQLAERRAGNVAAETAEYVRGTFALADTALRQLAIHGQRVGGPAAPADDWLPLLEAAEVALPGSGSVSVTDATGIIRHSTLAPIVGQTRHDNYLFRALADTAPDRLIVDSPFPSPLHEGRFILPVGRRLETADGRFDGVVVSVMPPDSFRDFFRSIDVGREGSISVFHPGGAVLFREPSGASALGEPAADHPVLRAAARTATPGVVAGPLAPGGPAFRSAYRTLSDPQLVVAVSLSEYEALADWRAQRRTTAIGFTLFAATLGGLVLLLVRQIDARSTVEHDLADVQRREAARLRDANERLEAALRREQEAREEAESANRLKDEFLMTLSHELRTPLNAIAGWTRMLLGGAVSEDQRTRALTTIERNAEAQTRLVEDLLDVSRAITGKLQLAPRPVDAGEVVIAAVETLRPAIAARRLRFTCDVEPALPPIVADADRLQQIVWNLLSNAIKFSTPGGDVTLAVRTVAGALEIEVRDGGVGIPRSFLPFVFDRFRQADGGTRRETAGLGLGLAIARHLVELHGGSILADSDGEGEGATFVVRLPAGPVSA